ncbi:MAG TPA: Uma2 family endonuclease [Gemmataceae bacterium]|nr:Uma2 family endonuclease [Gemmataceae bacterium]
MVTAASAPAQPLLTAEEFEKLPDDGIPRELVRGKVVEMNVPAPRHGEICINIALLIGPAVRQRAMGRLVSNDSGVITERGPDTVRGPDIAYFSYKRVPQGPLPPGYLDVAPELVFEVRSPTDRWPRLIAKAAEYLEAGVSVVCLLDQVSETVQVYRADELPRTLHGDDELHLPDVLGDLRVTVRQFFE